MARWLLPIALVLWALALQPALSSQTAARPEPAVREPLTRDQFAGGFEQCRACHARQVRTFETTAHWRTSRIASRESIVAPFGASDRMVATANPELHYRLEAKDDGFYETAIVGPAATARARSQRIDLVIGSGKKGQTYLWWRGDELLQLPLSYWTESGTWSANPGFSDRVADFTRPVVARCLDCHSTWFEPMGQDGRFNKTTALLGISCEKCHGPAAAHVAARRANPKGAAAPGRDVVNPARLTRDQKVDLCASCHGGQKLGPPFSFVPGDPVKHAPISPAAAPSAAMANSRPVSVGIDSHGQQARALMNSRCFQASDMTCETCHVPHVRQGPAASYAARCLTCHDAQACGRFPRDGRALVGRCVECHMPLQTSGLIASTNARGMVQAKLRSHLIAVHPSR